MERIQLILITLIVMLLIVFSSAFYLIFLSQGRDFSTPSFSGKIIFKSAFSIDGVRYDAEKRLIFAFDSQQGVIYVSNLNGKLIGKIRKRKYGESGFLSIKDILPYENGILVSDPEQRQVFFARLNSKQVEFIDARMPVLFKPGKLARGEYLTVYVADYSGSEVYRFGPDGSYLGKITVHENSDEAIAGMDYKDGCLYLLFQNSSKIACLNRRSKYEISLSGRKGQYLPFDLRKAGNYFFVPDPIYQEVLIFEKSGREVSSFGYSVSPERKMDLPVSIDVYGNLVFVAEKKERSVSIWKTSF